MTKSVSLSQFPHDPTNAIIKTKGKNKVCALVVISKKKINALMEGTPSNRIQTSDLYMNA